MIFLIVISVIISSGHKQLVTVRLDIRVDWGIAAYGGNPPFRL